MKSNYKILGPYIREVDIRNTAGMEENLLGVSTQKVFIVSIANTVGTDFSKYKIVKRGQFTYVPDTSRRGDKIGLAMLDHLDEGIVSSAYTVFEIVDYKELMPEYLMMWFRRPEFDRYARFMSHGSVRELFGWEEMCNVELPIPSLKKQKEIVAEYNTIVNRIKLNEQLNQKLEETAQAIYKQWFVDFETGDETELDEYIQFNPKYSISKGKSTSYVEMADLQEDKLSIRNVIKRPFTSGSKFMQGDTLLARITPCLENGKIAFVDCLEKDDIAFGSTEFIVMRPKTEISPFWVYCLARDMQFRDYAISSMVGSSGRQRVHSDYLKEYKFGTIDFANMKKFENLVMPMFSQIQQRSNENRLLHDLASKLLASLATKSEMV